MELFLLTLTFLVYVCQHGPEDAIHAVKGTTPPRYKVKAAAAAHAGTAYTAPRYATKDWFADLWSDSLTANTDWRRRRAADKAGQRVSRPVPVTSNDGSAATPVAVPAAAARPEPDIDLPVDDATQVLAGPESEDDGAEPIDCPDEQEPHDGPMATVIPMFKPFQPKETEMSIDVNAEIQGLVQSIGHAQLCVDACIKLGTAEGEGYLAHLAEGDNGQATIEAASAMQEAFDNALPQAQRLLDLLEAQFTVKEASNAVNGEHGSREFMNAGE